MTVSVMDEMDDQRIAAQIQELQEKSAQSGFLDVRVYSDEIKIKFDTPGEERSSSEIIVDLQEDEEEYEQMMTAIGEVLAHGHTQLQYFCLFGLNCENNSYPQFWRGLAANQVLKTVDLYHVTFPDEPNVAPFLANPALELLNMSGCNFSHGNFRSFCQNIQSSHIKKLRIRNLRPPQRVPWSSLWPALEHGTNRLESLNVKFAEDTPHGIENGFESFLTNNATIQSLCLGGFHRGHDDLSFLQALGRALAVNTTVKILNLDFSSAVENPAVGEQMIQTVFPEGLDQNMMVESLTVEMEVSPEPVDALADGLEQMMRNRASAATRGGHGQEESLPVLKELAVHCPNSFSQDTSTDNIVCDLFFDRLSRSGVIRVEKVKVTQTYTEQLLSPSVYDFIRSTRVTKSLKLIAGELPNDNAFIDLADAMEANKFILEVEAGNDWYHKMSTLLSTPNKYRIRCQCRRNEIQVETLRKDENLSLLPLVLARLLSLDDRPAEDEERSEIEARQLVDLTIAFEMLQDIPALFAVCGKRKREE